MPDSLKLIALDEQDMQIISAYVQDSLTSVQQMEFNKQNKQFSMPIRRYVWEAEKKQKWLASIFPRKERRLAVLHFNSVKSVRKLNVKNEEEILCLLAVEAGEKEIIMNFAANVKIKLEVENIEAQLTDISQGWKSQSMPRHGKGT